MLRRSLIFLALVLSVYGCASAPALPTVVEVPVSVACVPQDFSPSPQYPDTKQALEAAPDLFERVKLLLIGKLMRDQRLTEFEAALSACRGDT